MRLALLFALLAACAPEEAAPPAPDVEAGEARIMLGDEVGCEDPVDGLDRYSEEGEARGPDEVAVGPDAVPGPDDPEWAAIGFESAVVGVVLTGASEDGAAGLAEVQRRGGLSIVQDPADAEASVMPQAALDAVRADHVASLAEIPGILAQACDPVPGRAGD